ncbi:GtrA family protein [Clavibacter zhangzhiyongii]|uniref:GtrA family protein n=1 Tax=Clavibacter zhangzhiyongii TaxID=2768071 RepID=A0A7L7Z002_9MICO|nr:GtrA family protein [Clavibacter zhangzhiyongii]MBM7025767.1 GtrA family protein [Clavibacter zhangzhiyongii]QOD43032.1 GtrA family protein [Clavibacter zhangzhiyongii]
MTKLLADRRVRFLIAGLLNTGLDFVLLNLLILGAAMPVIGANLVSVTVGITISYFLNHFFVFRHGEAVTLGRFLKFFAVTGFSSLLLQSGVIWLFERGFDTTFGRSLLTFGTSAEQEFLEINIAKATAVLIGLVWNFTLYRLVVFRTPTPGDAAAADGSPAVRAAASAD